MEIRPRSSSAGRGVVGEELLQLVEQVGCRSEVAELVVPESRFGSHALGHPGAVVAMEGIALDERGVDVLAPEDLGERLRDRGRPGARGPGDRDDRMEGRHVVP